MGSAHLVDVTFYLPSWRENHIFTNVAGSRSVERRESSAFGHRREGSKVLGTGYWVLGTDYRRHCPCGGVVIRDWGLERDWQLWWRGHRDD